MTLFITKSFFLKSVIVIADIIQMQILLTFRRVQSDHMTP